MGWKKGAAAGAAAGAWAGPLGMLIGGIGGALLQKTASGSSNSDTDEIQMDFGGVSFCYGSHCIAWENIAEANDVLLVCKGGLIIEYDGVSNKLGNVDVDKLTKVDKERAILPVSIDPLESDIKTAMMVAQDLLWAIDTADELRGKGNFTINEGALFYGCVNVAASLLREESKDKQVADLIEKIRKGLRGQFSRIDSYLDDVKEQVGVALLVLSNDDFGGKVSQQKARYEELSAYGKYSPEDATDEDPVEERKDAIAPLLPADGKGEILGAPAWYNERKTLICTETPMSLTSFARKRRLDGIMAMEAADVVLYNDSVEDQALKLVFQPGHPQNGCTYIQHPFRKNQYFEVNSFHDSILERKQNELLRILESLGAYSARVEVRHEQHTTSNLAKDSHFDAKASVGKVSGEMSHSANAEQASTLFASQSATKDWSFNPPEKPMLPDDLVFYPTEETWQQLANSVLRGGLKRAEVDLEYKSEYGIDEKHLSDVSAAAKSVIPSFQMNLKQGFTSNLKQLTTTQWHYVVAFENESGERAGARITQAKAVETPALTVGDNKVEALFMKRAKRYAQSEGHINAEQRAGLEALAKKYGIDDFRMEELIEEAFDAV